MPRYMTLILLLGLGACYAAVIPNSVNDVLVTGESNVAPQSVGVQEADDLETAATSYNRRGYYGGGYGGHYDYPDHYHHHHDHYDDYHHHHHDDYHHHYDDYHHHHHEPYYNDYYGHHHHHHDDSIGFGIPGLFDIHLGK